MMNGLRRVKEAVGRRCGFVTASELEAVHAELAAIRGAERDRLTAKDVGLLRMAVKRFGGPHPARYFSIIPDVALRPPLAPVSEHLGTPVHSTTFDGIARKWDREECIARDKLPLPALEDREYYHPGRELDYWLSGLRDYFRVSQELERAGAPLRDGQTVFELGAASGRVLRHFVAQDDHRCRLVAADLNSNHMEWILRYFPSDVRAFQTSAFPVLPLEDNSLDLVMAFSVFTHIDEYELSWIMEIRRVLKPGGVAYLTFQSDRTWGTLHEGHFLYQHLKNNEDKLGGCRIEPGLFKQGMPEPKVVYRFTDANVYNTVVFQSCDYIRNRWGRCFSRLDILPAAHEFQDVALCRK